MRPCRKVTPLALAPETAILETGWVKVLSVVHRQLFRVGKKAAGPSARFAWLTTLLCSTFALRVAGFSLSGAWVCGILLLAGKVPIAAGVPLTEAVLARLTGSEVTIAGARFTTGQETVSIAFSELTATGSQSVKAENGVVALSLRGLLRKRPMPESISVERITADVATGAAPVAAGTGVPVERLLALLSSGAAGRLSLPRVDIAYRAGDALVAELKGGRVEGAMAGDAYEVKAWLPFELGSGARTEAELDVISRADGTTDFLFASDGTPLGPLLAVVGVDVVQVGGELAGLLALSVDAEGRPIGGAIDLTVTPGEGSLVGTPFSFGENRLEAAFEKNATMFRIERLSYDVADNRGDLSGTVSAVNVLRPAEIVLDFDISGRDLVLDLKSLLDAPVEIATLSAEGRFDAAARYLGFDELRASYFGSEARGSLALTFPEGFKGNPRIQSDAVLPGPLTPQQVLAGWPTILAAEAREWVVENLTEGKLTNLAYTSDIPMNAIEEGKLLPDETMDFTFDASEATVIYLPDMPPVTSLTASALVRGNSFTVRGESGKVAGVDVRDAVLSMPAFMPLGATSSFTGTLVGEVPAILAALEEAALVSFEDVAFTPQSFSGRGSFDLSITWPLSEIIAEDEVLVSGEGAFARASIDDVMPGVDATEASGRVILDPDRLFIEGSGLIATAPSAFTWSQSLRGEMTTELSVTSTLDTLAADMIGVPLRQFFRGNVKSEVFTNDLRPGAPMQVIGELTDATVSIPGLGIRKPAGVDAFFETTFALPEPGQRPGGGGPVRLDQLRLTAPSFNIEGSGVFTQEGAVRRLELPRLFIENSADLSLRLVTEDRALDLSITGEHASLAPLLDRAGALKPTGGGGLPGDARIDVDLARVTLLNNVDLYDVKAAGRHTGEDVEQFTLTARIGEDGAMNAAIDRPPGHELGFVEIEATDFGTLAEGLFGISSVTGAAGSLKGTMNQDEGFQGRFETSQLLIRNAPLLAKVLSFTSLDGAIDALNGDGIRFSKLEGDVALHDSVIGFSDVNMIGPSLGLSASGMVDLEAGFIDVRGAIAPAYALNGFLGSLPGIGRLFVSREGEGLVAFAYSINGPLEQPRVTVNALSALTPGILRRIFDPLPEETRTLEALERATNEAEERDDLSEAP